MTKHNFIDANKITEKDKKALRKVKIHKKSGNNEDFDEEKILRALHLAAQRTVDGMTDEEIQHACAIIEKNIAADKLEVIEIETMHAIVEKALSMVDEDAARAYMNYRNYKKDFVNIMLKIHDESKRIQYLGDRENANVNSALVATKRCLIFNYLNKELYQMFFLSPDEREAIETGYLYVHDMSARNDTMNCCLSRVGDILQGGFTLSNIFYTEPKTVDTVLDVISDIVLAAASQQYGGFTVPRFDTIVAPYAEKSYKKYVRELTDEYMDFTGEEPDASARKKISVKAKIKVKRDLEQGIQGLEMKFNTVGSSRGDYPFITFTFGLDDSEWGKAISEALLRVRMGGQGKPGFKKPVLFPKLVFLFDENLHGKDCKLEYLFDLAVQCTSKTMLPDYRSLTGEGYVSDIYKKYKLPISPMGCRAYLSPYWERGGQEPADENDIPVFEGRFNIGAVTLNLPMIYQKAKVEGTSFFAEIRGYMEMARHIHLRTRGYLGNMKASTNPLQYCEGGFLGGHLNPDDKIAPLLDSATASFGYIGLNEVQRLHNGKSLVEDKSFAEETLKYINDIADVFKKEDHLLYAIYATPAESYAGKSVALFKKKYGIIPNVSDRDYFTNGFHCHVSENITPFAKQDIEKSMFHMSNGGHIQYVRVLNPDNFKAVKAIICRGMKYGFYQGINFDNCFCEDCGTAFVDGKECPHCHSKHITIESRVCGYLGYQAVEGNTRLNDSKLAEIHDRVSM